jgi:hypothetical protein
MRLPHPFALFVLCGATLVLTCGCEDSQAQQRAEVHKTIKAATEQLSAAAAIRVDLDQQDRLRRDLNDLIVKLSDTTDGEPGQRAAASRLAGSAHRTLASIDLTQVERLEAEHRARRRVVDGMIDAALELDTVAEGQEAIDTSAEQDKLTVDREAAGAQLQEHARHMATLDGPIAELNRQNRDDRAQAERLREEASQLRREAADMGPAEGYTTFERSLQLDRQADRIEFEVARRELELRFILEPEHDVAQSRIEQAQTRIETDDGARQSLEDAAQGVSEQARATRLGVDELGERIAAALGEIEQSSSGTLAELYDRAGSNLDRAASKSKSAATMARGEGTDAARVEAARAYQQLGDMYLSKARGLEQGITLRRRLTNNADALAGVTGADTPPARLQEAHAEATGQAIAAYTNAQDVLGQVAGRTARLRLEALKAKISVLQAASSGQTVDFSAVAGDSPSPAGPRRPSPTPGGGVETPQALVDALRNATGVQALAEFNLSLTHIEFQTPAHQQIYEAMNAANRAMLELEQALQEKLGSGLMDQFGGGGGQGMTGGPAGFDAGALGTAEINLGEVSGNRGSMTVSTGDQAREIGLIRINGRWYVDGTEDFNTLVAMAGDQAMLLQTLQSMGTATVDLSRRVRAGELASIQEVMMALGQAMQGQQ